MRLKFSTSDECDYLYRNYFKLLLISIRSGNQSTQNFCVIFFWKKYCFLYFISSDITRMYDFGLLYCAYLQGEEIIVAIADSLWDVD